jgi:hypothetical protein
LGYEGEVNEATRGEETVLFHSPDALPRSGVLMLFMCDHGIGVCVNNGIGPGAGILMGDADLIPGHFRSLQGVLFLRAGASQLGITKSRVVSSFS